MLQINPSKRDPKLIRTINHIGKDIHRCPFCKGPMSHGESGYFCRCIRLRGLALARKEREA